MAMFYYTSIDHDGNKHSGILEGDSSHHVYLKIHALGWAPVEIREQFKSDSKIKNDSRAKKQKLRLATLSLLTYQMGALLSAGLTVDAALLNIADQMDKNDLKSILLTVRSFVLEGRTLASAMEEFPGVFSTLYRSIISAGEMSGQLVNVINQLGSYLDQQILLNQKVQQALLYPALLTTVSLTVIIFLLTYVMPKITAVFLQNNASLPLITKFMIFVSAGIKMFGPYLLILVIISFFSIRAIIKIPRWKYRYHLLLLRAPMMSSSLVLLSTTRFIRTFSILFSASVPILDAMRLANNTIKLIPIQNAIEAAIAKVSQGVSLHQALSETKYFSKLVTQLIASGEVSGKLDFMLEKSASYQEKSIVIWIDFFLALFEPVLILVMGVLVLCIVLAVLLPIFQMNEFFG